MLFRAASPASRKIRFWLVQPYFILQAASEAVAGVLAAVPLSPKLVAEMLTPSDICFFRHANEGYGTHSLTPTVERIEHRWHDLGFTALAAHSTGAAPAFATPAVPGSITCNSSSNSTDLCCHNTTECKDKQNTVVSQQFPLPKYGGILICGTRDEKVGSRTFVDFGDGAIF